MSETEDRLSSIESKVAAIDGKLDALLFHLGVSELPLFRPEFYGELIELFQRRLERHEEEKKTHLI